METLSSLEVVGAERRLITSMSYIDFIVLVNDYWFQCKATDQPAERTEG